MPVVPTAATIEAARAALKKGEPKHLAAQIAELKKANAPEKMKMMQEYQYGYALGLETARCILAANEELGHKDVAPDTLL